MGQYLKKFDKFIVDFESVAADASPQYQELLQAIYDKARATVGDYEEFEGIIYKNQDLSDRKQRKAVDGALAKMKVETRNIALYAKMAEGALGKADKATQPAEYRAAKLAFTQMKQQASLLIYNNKSQAQKIDKQAKDLSGEEKAVALAKDQLKKALLKGRVGMQMIKAKPAKEVWDNEMKKGMGRDIKMALVTMKKVKGAGGRVSDNLMVDDCYKQILPWDTGKAKSTWKKDPTDKEILARLKEFSALMKHITRMTGVDVKI